MNIMKPINMGEEKLVITLEPIRVPRGRFRRWWFFNVYWRVWKIWKPRFLSFVYGNLARFIYWLSPKRIKEEIDAGMQDIEIVIRTKGKDENSSEKSA